MGTVGCTSFEEALDGLIHFILNINMHLSGNKYENKVQFWKKGEYEFKTKIMEDENNERKTDR